MPLGDRTVLAAVWRVRAGRVSLFLLDTDLHENAPRDRELSARLYGGDRETRLQQEIVLGIGGVRALRALGFAPALYHLNEGHAAFVVLQRIRDLCEQGQTFEAALAEVRRTTVFTTHTPVPAGHDAFPFGMVETHLAGLWGDLGENRARFLELGSHDNGAGPMFNMTALAMRTAASVNGVSQLHGEVTRQMWQSIWPDTPVSRVPVKSLTNGVHVPTWMSAEIARLLDRYLGPDWLDNHDDPALGDRVLEIPDEELWAARVSLRTFLFQFVRERARQRWTTEGGAAARVVAAGTMFDQNALTIGFARRFTGYKRPELLFTDPQRLAGILNKWGRPVQFVFAGKAHPADDIGKHHLQHIYHRALDPMFGGRIALVDDYDMHVAHFLVQGCDVWLNNPRKPLEASGTSGMKAAINGTPHLSIGDGWWAEGFTGENGWLIEGTANPDDHGAQDWADAQALYTLLEQQLVPAFYDRDALGHAAPLAADREAVDPHRAAALQRAAHGEGVCAATSTSPAVTEPAQGLKAPAQPMRNAGVVRSACPPHPPYPPHRVRRTRPRYTGSNGPEIKRREDEVRAVRRQGRLGTPRRGTLLPRLLGKEDRGRGGRRPRVRAEALHPRPQRREIPDLSLHDQAAERPDHRRGRRLRPVSHDGALPQLRLGRARLPPRGRPGRAHVRRDPGGRRRHRGHRAVGRRQVAPRSVPLRQPGTGRLER